MNPNVSNDDAAGGDGGDAADARAAALPAILLVEDDPTTRAYLSELLRTTPAEVEAAESVADALRQAHTRRFALWVIDANLPDGTGAGLLAQLRSAFPNRPALAHTAARDRSELDPLLRAGFNAVLTKPVDAQAWLATIRGALGGSDQPNATMPSAPDRSATDTLDLWDDAAAARALGGNPANVRALRTLFLAELPGQLAAIESADAQICQQHLHRLRASCGFVGAARLQAAADALHHAPGAPTLRVFLDVARETLARAPMD